MPRRKPGLGQARLRDELLAEAKHLRELYGQSAPGAFEELSKPVHQLEAGEVYRLHRFELPFDHPARDAGAPHDFLTLDSNDVLREGIS